MKHGSDWYKREPTAYLGGVQGMTAKEHAVYSIVLDLIYQHGGSVNDDPAWISGWISDMGSAAVRKAIESLIQRGKLVREGDQLTNTRAKSEAKTKENLRETREKTGKKGGIASGKSRAVSNENKGIAEALASPREEKRREESSSSSARESADDPESWTDDRLLDEVMAAVGVRGYPIPTHWMPPGSTLHVGRWRRDLGLSCRRIVDAARASRANHAEPPNGPKALDATMRRLAAELTADPMTPAPRGGKGHSQQSEREQKMKRWAKIANGGSHDPR